MGVFENRR